MSDKENKLPEEGGDRIERLLGRAEPRPVPPADDARLVRDAVHTVWRQQVRRRRTRHAVSALAATIVAAIGLAIVFDAPEELAPVQVAGIERHFGSVYLVPTETGLVPLEGQQVLMQGQTVQTARDAGLSMDVNGVSVRLDADSRVELVGQDKLYLQRGRIYVDTASGNGTTVMVVRTDQGSIRHLGTQFMVTIASDELTVSVREGDVEIDGKFYDSRATEGERVTLKGTSRPVVDRVAGYGNLWQWTEALAPRRDLDGMPAGAFLEWVGAQTGYRIVYADEAAKNLVSMDVLVGEVDKPPREELHLRLMTMGLAYELDSASGEIRIRDPGQ